MTRKETKYPNVKVRLTGTDGNGFNVLGRVQRALREAGVSPVEITRFREEATTGDYDHLLRTAMRWVTVD